MKTKITFLLLIILGFITKVNAQCEPYAGEDAGVCGLDAILYAQLSSSTSTCHWLVKSTPAGGSATILNENDTVTQVSVTITGVYEFKVTETNGACTGSDIIRKEFVRMPNGAAGPDKQICGQWAELNASADTYPGVEMGWHQTSVIWVDTLGSTSTNPSTRLLPHGYVYNPNLTNEYCSDTVEFVWQQSCSGVEFPTVHCVATDTMNIVFSSNVVAETQTGLPSEVCGKFIELNAIETQTTCINVSGYWIDNINYTVNWWTDTTHTVQGNGPHTIAQNITFHENAYAYVVQSGACTDTSNFQTVYFTDCITKITNVTNETGITIYPNPAHNKIVIAGVEENVNIQVFDITGKQTNVVCHHEQSEGTYDESILIDISVLENGIYFIKIGNSVAKFIKE